MWAKKMAPSLPTSLKVLLWVAFIVFYMMLSYVGSDLSMPCHLSYHTDKYYIQIRSGPLRVLYEMKKKESPEVFLFKTIGKEAGIKTHCVSCCWRVIQSHPNDENTVNILYRKMTVVCSSVVNMKMSSCLGERPGRRMYTHAHSTHSP